MSSKDKDKDNKKRSQENDKARLSSASTKHCGRGKDASSRESGSSGAKPSFGDETGEWAQDGGQ